MGARRRRDEVRFNYRNVPYFNNEAWRLGHIMNGLRNRRGIMNSLSARCWHSIFLASSFDEVEKLPLVFNLQRTRMRPTRP